MDPRRRTPQLSARNESTTVVAVASAIRPTAASSIPGRDTGLLASAVSGAPADEPPSTTRRTIISAN
jgi:hypothetical protein